MALLGSRNDERTWGEATGRRFLVSTRTPQLASLPPPPPRGPGPIAKEESTEQLATTNDGGLKYYLSNCPRNRIRPSLKLDEIRTEHVQRLKTRLSELNPKTANNVLTVLNTMLRVAKDWGLISELPKIRLLKWQPPEMEYYDFPAWEALTRAAEAIDPQILLTVLLGGEAGLRAGEIVALEQSDVDFRRGVLKISRAEREGQVTSPKGGRGREVPMTDRLADALRKARHLAGDRVLRRSDGLASVERPLLSKWMARAQKRAGLRANGGIHILRHTFCSHLAMRGAPLMAIKELAGHRQVSTTMRYMHLSPAAKESAIALLNAGGLLEAKTTSAKSDVVASS
jgi:integrase